MKALSVRQPWAHAIFHLGKDVENRTWPTHYRGLILIHAASKTVERIDGLPDGNTLPRGVILGSVELIDCVRDGPSRWAMPGHWHWLLRNPRLLRHPVPARGRLGLFDRADIVEAIAEQITPIRAPLSNLDR